MAVPLGWGNRHATLDPTEMKMKGTHVTDASIKRQYVEDEDIDAATRDRYLNNPLEDTAEDTPWNSSHRHAHFSYMADPKGKQPAPNHAAVSAPAPVASNRQSIWSSTDRHKVPPIIQQAISTSYTEEMQRQQREKYEMEYQKQVEMRKMRNQQSEKGGKSQDHAHSHGPGQQPPLLPLSSSSSPSSTRSIAPATSTPASSLMGISDGAQMDLFLTFSLNLIEEEARKLQAEMKKTEREIFERQQLLHKQRRELAVKQKMIEMGRGIKSRGKGKEQISM